MTITKVQLFSGGSTTALQRQINEFVADKRDVLEVKLHNAPDGQIIVVLHYVEVLSTATAYTQPSKDAESV